MTLCFGLGLMESHRSVVINAMLSGSRNSRLITRLVLQLDPFRTFSWVHFETLGCLGPEVASGDGTSGNSEVD